MNESWWEDDPTFVGTAHGWFRPAAKYQVEWDFPLVYGDYRHEMTLPETVAVARLIERIDPDYLISLHNGTVAGAHILMGGSDRDFACSVSKALIASGLQILPHIPIPYCK